MAEAAEIFTTVPTDLALRNAEISAMRTLNDSVNNLIIGIRDLATDVREVRDKVLTIEASKYEAQLVASILAAKEANEELEKSIRRELETVEKNAEDMEIRMRASERLLSRFGFALAGFGTIGGTAIGTIVTILITRIIH